VQPSLIWPQERVKTALPTQLFRHLVVGSGKLPEFSIDLVLRSGIEGKLFPRLDRAL